MCTVAAASGGGQRPSLAHYVTEMGPMDGATAAGGRSCCLPSHYVTEMGPMDGATAAGVVRVAYPPPPRACP
jgi:hypothetical protein